MIKRLLITIVLILTSVSSLGVHGLEFKSRDGLNLDDGLIIEESNYGLPTKILLAPLFFPSENVSIDSREWIRGLHYYSVARLGYPDIPFHYIVLPNGDVYKANKNGDEAEIPILDSTENSIIVAYLARQGSRDFSEEAKATLTSLLVSLANTHLIENQSLELVNIRFNLNTQTHLASLETRSISGGWTQTFRQLQKEMEANYSPLRKKFNIEIVNVKVPQEEVKPGQTAIIELAIRNIGEYTIFADADSALIATKANGSLSRFFLNGIWASQSQVSILSEGDMIRPGQEKSLQVKFSVPLYFGVQTEEFYLSNMYGDKIENTDFSVSLTVGKLDKTVVEIVETETGYLNVRSSDSGNSEVITRVSPGERYILKRRGTFGYVELDLGEGKSGWVSQKYVKEIN